MLPSFLIKYSSLVQKVDANLPRGMDNLLVFHDDAYMGNAAIFVAEESQIAGLGFLQEIH